jgi:hypothetical protein
MSAFRLCVTGLILVGLLGGAFPADSATVSSTTAQRSFTVFDATLYKNKPSFSGYPIRPITLLYESRLFPGKPSPTAMPQEQTVRSIAKELRAASQPVVVDIERWPFKGEPQTVKESVSKYLTVLSWIKAEAPNIQVGIYETIPLRDYWRAIRGPGSQEYRAWQQDNDRLDEMVAQLDALYPSIYTFYPDRQGWVTYAVAQLAEAKRKAKGKPVYAFLWPQYHASEHSRQYAIEPDYWELQLETIYQHADGIVIWGGWGKDGPEPWKEDAPWWQVTKRFMRQIDSDSPDRPNNLSIR